MQRVRALCAAQSPTELAVASCAGDHNIDTNLTGFEFADRISQVYETYNTRERIALEAYLIDLCDWSTARSYQSQASARIDGVIRALASVHGTDDVPEADMDCCRELLKREELIFDLYSGTSLNIFSESLMEWDAELSPTMAADILPVLPIPVLYHSRVSFCRHEDDPKGTQEIDTPFFSLLDAVTSTELKDGGQEFDEEEFAKCVRVFFDRAPADFLSRKEKVSPRRTQGVVQALFWKLLHNNRSMSPTRRMIEAVAEAVFRNMEQRAVWKVVDDMSSHYGVMAWENRKGWHRISLRGMMEQSYHADLVSYLDTPPMLTKSACH